jgi:hypothetical protein
MRIDIVAPYLLALRDFSMAHLNPGLLPISANKMITVHEKMYRDASSEYRRKILFSGFGGRKGSNSMGKISTFGVPSAMLGTGSSTPRQQALCHAIDL